jgi:GR25 family glycosyltransferase involved in LPS biosynthesis
MSAFVKIINLDSKPERYAHTTAVASRLLPKARIERFSGIVPTAVEAEALGIASVSQLWGGLGALGCYLSHKTLYEECVARALPSMLILEDDAQDYSFGHEVLDAAIAELPPGWHMLYLTIHPRNGRAAYEQVSQHLIRPSHGTTTSAYIISFEGAQRVLEHLNKHSIIEIDTALEALLPSPDIYACTPFVSSQRNGDVSTIEGRFTSFNCGAPYYVPTFEGRIVVDCRLCTSWIENLQLLAQVVRWQKTYAPTAAYPACLVHESMPASFPFAKVYEGTATVFDPPLSECDSGFAQSVLNMICGGNTVPAEILNKAVSWDPHSTLPYLTGPGAITVPIKPGHEFFSALWLASMARTLAMQSEWTPLFYAVCQRDI